MAVSSNYGSGVFPNGTDFPFVTPSYDVRGLFEDLFLSFDGRSSYVYPLKVSQVSGFKLPYGSASSSSLGSGSSSGSSSYGTDDNIVISDSANTVVFDSSSATHTSKREWGVDRVIYTWESSSVFLTVVQHVGAGSTDRADVFEPIEGILDERTYQKESYKVNSIKIGSTYLKGNITLVAGYNMVFSIKPTVDVEGTRKVNQIQVGSVGGYGLGVYPYCPEGCISDAVQGINGVGPSIVGNYSLVATNCYWFGVAGESDSTRYRPFDAADHALSLKNNCLPCCECDDYVYTYRAIQNLYSRFKGLGDRAMKTRTQHYANQDRWIQGKTCRENSSMRIFALPAAGGIASVLVTYCNTTPNYIGPIRLEIDLETGGKPGSLGANGATWYPATSGSPISIDPEGEWPNYIFRWDSIAPGKSAKVRFMVDIVNGNSSDYLLISAQTIHDTVDETIIASATPYSIGLRD